MQKLKDLWKGTGVTVPVSLAFDEASAAEIINDYETAIKEKDIESFFENPKWTTGQKNILTDYARHSDDNPTVPGLVEHSQKRRKQEQDANNSK